MSTTVLQVQVVMAVPDQYWCVSLGVDGGATVADALALAADTAEFQLVDLSAAAVGIWGEVVTRQQTLLDGDRVEIYRPVQIDAKSARRRRAAEQKAQQKPSRSQAQPSPKREKP